MGKTTNTLITAGDFALQGQIFVDSLRTMYKIYFVFKFYNCI